MRFVRLSERRLISIPGSSDRLLAVVKDVAKNQRDPEVELIESLSDIVPGGLGRGGDSVRRDLEPGRL
jgi:hypothetical protein